MSTSKIKINPVTKEIEIEVSDEFLLKYFQSLGMMIGKSKTFKVSKSEKKIDKKEKKTKIKPVKKEKIPKGAIYEGVIAALKLSKGAGMNASEIAEATDFTVKQVTPILQKALKKDVIKRTDRGSYEYVKKVVNNKKKTELITE